MHTTNGAEYRPVVIDIIQRAASIELHVINVTINMGSPSKAIWMSFGANQNITPVAHPATPDRKLFFMTNVPHLIKNLKSALVHGQVFFISPDIVQNHDLPSDEVSVVPVKDLVTFQKGMALKLAPRLKVDALDKMKVGPALRVFRRATSAGLPEVHGRAGETPSLL